MSGTVLGAKDTRGKDRASPGEAHTPGGEADNTRISKLRKVFLSADKCDGGDKSRVGWCPGNGGQGSILARFGEGKKPQVMTGRAKQISWANIFQAERTSAKTLACVREKKENWV